MMNHGYPGSRMYIIHVIACVGLVIRLWVALHSEYIHHPDEVFQYLEQAHRIVFGYGFIPWEYRFGTRSWILPGVLSVFLYPFKFFHAGNATAYIGFIKIVFCFFSISLVYSVYYIVKKIASESSAIWGAVCAALWYELIYFASKPNPEVVATYVFMIVLAVFYGDVKNTHSFLFGSLCAFIVALRVQYIVPVSLLYVCATYTQVRHNKIRMLAGCALIFCVAGLIDWITWGEFFVSYYNNIIFNKIYEVSSIFGVANVWYYFRSLLVASMGIFCISLVSGVFFFRKTWIILAAICATLVVHCLVPHKEYRFVFILIPMLLVLFSLALEAIRSIGSAGISNIAIILVFVVFFSASIMGALHRIPFQNDVYTKSIFSREEIFDAYRYLSNEDGVCFILNVAIPWHETGGYYYLHKFVPLISDLHEIDDNNSILRCVSHIICPVGYRYVAGFASVWKMKDIEVRKKQNTVCDEVSCPAVNCDVLQEGIDGVYEPKFHY